MKNNLNDQPRTFNVGAVEIHDHGKIELEAGEMITVVSSDGRKCDITSTKWGFYLGSSLNVRMAEEGFKTALVINEAGKIFINVVEKDKIDLFEKYLQENESRVISWLDEQT